MTGLVLGAVVLLAVVTVGVRRWRRSRDAGRRPGASLSRAIRVRRFDQMDLVLARRFCACGKRLRLTGEGSREIGVRRFRITHLACPECDYEETVYFDVTRVFH